MSERAYCAPSQQMAAQTMLKARGITIRDIAAHPWLTAPTVVIVIAPDVEQVINALDSGGL